MYSVVVRQGEMGSFVFFIVSGECRVVHRLLVTVPKKKLDKKSGRPPGISANAVPLINDKSSQKTKFTLPPLQLPKPLLPSSEQLLTSSRSEMATNRSQNKRASFVAAFATVQ